MTSIGAKGYLQYLWLSLSSLILLSGFFKLLKKSTNKYKPKISIILFPHKYYIKLNCKVLSDTSVHSKLKSTIVCDVFSGKARTGVLLGKYSRKHPNVPNVIWFRMFAWLIFTTTYSSSIFLHSFKMESNLYSTTLCTVCLLSM